MLFRKNYLFIFLISTILFPSGGYDHGTAAGKGNLDISLTWNPFNYFEQGQSYIVLGYGLTEKIELHGYYSKPVSGDDNYYFGMLNRFIASEHLDLSTARGFRKYTGSNTTHLFLPQLLYNIILGRGFTFGGSFVGVIKDKYYLGTVVDVAVFIPVISNKKHNLISDVKLGVGSFRPILWKPNRGRWHPTYSLDLKFNMKNI